MRAQGKREITLLAISTLVTAIQFLPARAERPSTAEQDNRDLKNFHQVNDYLYRGGMPTVDGIKKLKELGVTTIVDLRDDKLDAALERHVSVVEGVKYINLPTGDAPPRPEKLARFIYTLEQARRDNEQGKPGSVFVHCRAGSDRTGLYIAVWRVLSQGWRPEQAMLEMLRYGFQIHKLDFSAGSEAGRILAERRQSAGKCSSQVAAKDSGEQATR
ncbi:MAG: tyrosine-protein phosphatase [Candidatus Melainabacteria bacterium]|nr:tyrosine-protein phosphatase [Candidatus Melainabacteria bacterium]